MKGTEHEVEFEKLVPEGQALGRMNGKVVFAWGALPGERARVRVTKKKRTANFAEVVEILEPSPERREPREAHHLSCSPFQILDYERETELKRALLAETMEEKSGEALTPDAYHPAREVYGYRNKLEFSFTGGPGVAGGSGTASGPGAAGGPNAEDGPLQPAFFKRGTPFVKIPAPDGCVLGGEPMNRVAVEVTRRLREAGADTDALKTLIVRESKTTGHVLAGIFWRDRDRAAATEVDLEGIDGLAGHKVVYSRPNSPASTYDEVLAENGSNELEEAIEGMRIRYSFESFFQNHLGLFPDALASIREACPPGGKYVELYCGVGTIGLHVADRADRLVGVEEVEPAIELLHANARLNGVTHYDGIVSRAEKIDYELLEDTDVLLLDPPRAGLHPKAVKRILRMKPRRIVYLSCNPKTQAQDYAALRQSYALQRFEAFDFYPRTPRLETLMVLDPR